MMRDVHATGVLIAASSLPHLFPFPLFHRSAISLASRRHRDSLSGFALYRARVRGHVSCIIAVSRTQIETERARRQLGLTDSSAARRYLMMTHVRCIARSLSLPRRRLEQIADDSLG